MKHDIIASLNDARQLERLYRSDKTVFKREFSTLYPEIKGNHLADFWNERLYYESDDLNWGTRTEFVFMIVAALLAGVIAKLPAILPVSEEIFYPRNIGFIVFPFLTAYFAWKNGLTGGRIAFLAGATLLSVVFINLLPNQTKSDTVLLSCIHLLLVLWSLLGIAYVGNGRNHAEPRLDYLKYNGDLVVMTTLIVIAGGILTGVTIGLFSLIGISIERFYFDYVVVFGLPAAPLVGTYLTQSNPQLVGKVSPVIARMFSPLVLVMLLVYLVAMVYSGKDPYNDREFLLLFNLLLIGVMALIFFSVAETNKTEKSRTEQWVLLLLAMLTVIVNGIALSAILFRIAEWGMTPNRAAVLGGNVLILTNLLFVTVQLIRVVSKKTAIRSVGEAIAYFLPVYVVWAAIVTFLFPFVFGFQ